MIIEHAIAETKDAKRMTAERKTEERLPHRTAGQLAGISLRILRAQVIVTVGLTLVYLANLGVAPWDMLAIGISYHTPLQYGTALNVVGICVILADVFLREKIGLSTI
jgi:uncharacterized membrane protein YczE